MPKFKATIFLICAVIFTVGTFDLVTDNHDLIKENEFLTMEAEAYKKAYESALEKQTEVLDKETENVYDIAERIYNIDKDLLVAIERHETGNYTSDVYLIKNNTWGCIEGNVYRAFGSVEQSTLDLARCLRFYYYNYGLDTLEQIATQFCPNDVDNWVASIKQIYEEMKNER